MPNYVKYKIFTSHSLAALFTDNGIPTRNCHLAMIDIVKLSLLAAIWGGSFIAMRFIAADMSYLLAASLRIILAAIALLIFARIKQIPLYWRRNLTIYSLTGLFGAVLPFTLFSYAAFYLPAAFSALYNATCPLFVALFSMLWLGERLTLRKLLGLCMGVAGVLLLTGTGLVWQDKFTLAAAIACLAAPACFAISSIIIKLNTCSLVQNKIEPLAMATGSMVAAAVMMLPVLVLSLPSHTPSPLAIVLIAALALFPSALAQIIFIPLISRIGPTRAMSVSFLIPLFSILWGILFLQETVALFSLLGGISVLAATALIMKA